LAIWILWDWGHAKDYVRMQWMMLQQEQPEDFVIATGNKFLSANLFNVCARSRH
jgi:GDPmannose 4,6-dehydratase